MFLFVAATASFAQNATPTELKLNLLPNEYWWGGAVTLGARMIERHFTDSNEREGPDHKFASTLKPGPRW